MIPVPPRVHDLIRFDADAAGGALPDWVTRDPTTVWAVVRRQQAMRADAVAAGVRGRRRAQRQAIEVDGSAVLAVVTPESLVTADPSGLGNAGIPAALDAVRASNTFRGRAWGPTGSTGFQLATGLAAVHADSDLDLLVRAERFLPREEARSMLELLALLPCRVDCSVETPAGSVALVEWAGAATGPVLLRTSTGPLLVQDPWSVVAGALT